jgi:hypothetical protein
MSIVDKVLYFIENDLNICITEENKKLIIQKFYPDIENKFSWSCEIKSSFYEGVVSKEEYEKIQTLPSNTHIHFNEITKYVDDECELNCILPFTDDINKIKKFYDRGGEKKCRNYFNLMGYFYDFRVIQYDKEKRP